MAESLVCYVYTYIKRNAYNSVGQQFTNVFIKRKPFWFLVSRFLVSIVLTYNRVSIAKNIKLSVHYALSTQSGWTKTNIEIYAFFQCRIVVYEQWTRMNIRLSMFLYRWTIIIIKNIMEYKMHVSKQARSSIINWNWYLHYKMDWFYKLISSEIDLRNCYYLLRRTWSQ